ncbi:MAG: T9SS type A sorting domain-containing protein [Saprospiraceae bacterium]|nr:T9SS type A sorting domain-containing protein [Saprospiraceae bacterium]
MTTYLHPSHGPQPMCPPPEGNNTASHNPTWFRFVAWCTDLELEVCYNNCVDGPACFGSSDFGIQAAVYSDCSLNPNSAVGCDTDVAGCVNNSCRIVEMSGLEIGHIYAFLVDGCCGSACEIVINVVSVCGQPMIEEFITINGPTYNCAGGDTAVYFHPKPEGANTLHWYIDGVEVQAGQGGDAQYFRTVWANQGTYEICFDASNDPCISVNEDPEPTCLIIEVVDDIDVNITGDNFICQGESTILNAGSGYNSYLWSTGATTQTISVSASGTYSVTVVNGSSCIGEDSFLVTVVDNPVATASSNSPVCVGGTISLSSSGGNTYTWSGPNGFSSNLQNPSIPNATSANGGTYFVTVTDGNSCSSSTNTNVVVNLVPIGTATSNSPLCSGNTLNLMATGGVSYNWSGPNGFTSNDQNPSIPNAMPIHSGTYAVTVTNGNGCIHVPSTVVTINATPVPTASSNSPLCVGATLQLNAGGGATYNWSGPLGFASSNQNPAIPNISLNQGGTYSVTVTSAQGCSANTTTSVEINENPEPTIAGSNTFCAGGFTILSAGFGYSEYLWNTGSSAEEIYVDMAGTYSVTVTDDKGCTGSDEIVVTVGQFLYPVITGDSILCDGNGGMLNAGPGFATYEWSSGEQTQTITINAAGTYSVSVSDGTGCSGEDQIVVMALPAPIGVATSNSPVCTGQSIFLFGSGGNTYQWNGPFGFQSNVQNPVIPNAISSNGGIYAVTVTNSGGCTDIAATNVVVGTGYTLNASATLPNCAGDTLFLFGSGGVDYQWSGPNGYSSMQQNPVITNAGPANNGTYIVTDPNAPGCVVNDTIVINIPAGPTPEITGNFNICLGEQATLNAGPGFVGYFWSTGQIGQTITVSDAGMYWVLVTNSMGCIGRDTAFVEVTVNLNPKISGDLAVCTGDSSLLDAGSGYSSYLWNTGDTSQIIQVDSTGDYSVHVTNSTGCEGTDTVTFTIYGFPHVGFTVAPEQCKDSCDGSIVIAPGEGGYTYHWSNGDSLQTIENLCSGIYLVTVTSPGGCFIVDAAFVPAGVVLKVSISDNDSTLIATASGGFIPYSYLWSNGDTLQSIPKTPGMHSVQVTDASGCVQAATILITQLDEVVDKGGGIILYPNPADGILILSPIQVNVFEVDLTYKVFNAVGVAVTDGSIHRGDTPLSLNTSQWAPGSYMVQLRYSSGAIEVIPVVVIH